jgi:hypothetical protein
MIDFVFTTKISPVTSNYTAFGFSYDDRMGEDSICVCRVNGTSSNLVEHYYSPGGYVRPQLIDDEQPSIGNCWIEYLRKNKDALSKKSNYGLLV